MTFPLNIFKKITSLIPQELIAILVITALPVGLILVASNKVGSFVGPQKNNISSTTANVPASILPPPFYSPTSVSGKFDDVLGTKITNSPPTASSIPTYSPVNSSANVRSQQTYPIIPMGDISGLPDNQKQQFIDIYNRFIQTPGLRFMTQDQQNEVFKQIAGAYLQDYKNQLQQQITQAQSDLKQLQAQQNPTPTPASFQPDPNIIAKLDELRSTLDSETHRPVVMSVMEGRQQQDYQNWIKNNQVIYSQILGNSYYMNILNAILGAYGL